MKRIIKLDERAFKTRQLDLFFGFNFKKFNKFFNHLQRKAGDALDFSNKAFKNNPGSDQVNPLPRENLLDKSRIMIGVNMG